MAIVKLHRPVASSIIAAVLGAALASAALMSPLGMRVAQAQAEPITAANGVLLPPPGYDPVAASDVNFTESAVAPTTSSPPDSPADESAAADAPEAVAEATDTVADASDATADVPENGNSMTTVLGGADVAVSSVGGSYEVDSPNKRSGRNR